MQSRRVAAALVALLGIGAAIGGVAWSQLDEITRARTVYAVADRMHGSDERDLVLGSSTARRLGDGAILNCGKWLNRGIGSSTVPILLDWVQDTPLALEPQRILIYAGENDIARGAMPEPVLADTLQLVQALRSRFAPVHIHVLAIKPSPARRVHWDRFDAFTTQLSERAATDGRLSVHRADWFDRNGDPVAGSFLSDGVHLTPRGYDRLTRTFRQTC